MLSSREVRRLLDKLCGELGFCLPPAEIDRIAADPPTNALAFTDEAIRTEGLDPAAMDRHVYRRVRDTVIIAFREAAAAQSDG